MSISECNSKVVLAMAVLYLILYTTANAQINTGEKRGQHYRIMFYNVENLYDPFNDSLVQDEEFLPDGIRHWTYPKFLQKLNKLSKVILALGEWEPPVIIGLCEVENRFSSKKLAEATPIRSLNYNVIHEESPDPRGVDVVLLYRQSMAEHLYHEKISIVFPDDPKQHTRDILYAKLFLDKTDTIHVFVNHWPSKFGGLESSEKRRNVVAGILRLKIDSLMHSQPSALIIVMGDFNAGAEEDCMIQFLKNDSLAGFAAENCLINLSKSIPKSDGTHKFQGEWATIDHMIVSKSFFDKSSRFLLRDGKMHIFKQNFLLEKDEANMGSRPYRTFLGPAYHGGYSDHLPVFLDLIINNELESGK